MLPLLANLYDLLLWPTERLCLRRWRRELLADIAGEVIEIGAGTGLTLPCYPADITHLTLVEPDSAMRRRLAKAAARSRVPTSILPHPAEQLGSLPGSYDAAVCCLVLCSVADQSAVLRALYDLLRPGGRLYVLEHVGATQPGRRRWQQRLEPYWRPLAGNCHLTRDTAGAITAAGFEFECLHHDEIRPAPGFVRPAIRGVARKPQ